MGDARTLEVIATKRWFFSFYVQSPFPWMQVEVIRSATPAIIYCGIWSNGMLRNCESAKRVGSPGCLLCGACLASYIRTLAQPQLFPLPSPPHDYMESESES